MICDVRFGCVHEPYHYTPNIACIVAFNTGIPDTTPAVMVNRLCVSGMDAVFSGIGMI